jgi:hypothetical protein
MKSRKKPKSRVKQAQPAPQPSPRNRALHISLDFETAVEGLLNVKPKKKPPKE